MLQSDLYKALNGIFCIYKPTGVILEQVVRTLKDNFVRGKHCQQVMENVESNCLDQTSWLVTVCTKNFGMLIIVSRSK